MDVKSRKLELIEMLSKCCGHFFSEEYDIFELNGWEGLLVWSDTGFFYQFSYKNPSSWSLTMFPYDIYAKRVWMLDCDGNGYWEEKSS